MLLLNKTDLLSKQEQQQLQALLKKLNPSAKVGSCVHLPLCLVGSASDGSLLPSNRCNTALSI